MRAFIRVLKDIALMLTHIIMGVMMVTHGWYHWQNEGTTAEANVLEHTDIPSPELMMRLLIGFEVIGGVSLIFGLTTPVVGLGLIVLNIGIILTLRLHTFCVYNFGWEYSTVMIIIGLMLMTHDAERVGLDNLSRTSKDIQPQAEKQPERPTCSPPEEPAHSLPDEWSDTPARGIQLPQEIHGELMAKPHSGLSQ